MSHGTGPSVRSPMCKTGAREIGGKFEIIETGGNRRKKKGGVLAIAVLGVKE